MSECQFCTLGEWDTNQCPSGLSFISTDTDEYTATVSTRGVNALLGFPSFLRYFFMPSHLRWFFVSIPFWAFLHFYKKTKNWKENSKEVSMPFWAFLHFYQDNGDCYDERMDLCQCPSGLSFISTASFWNPQKQSIFQAFFAGIYLKILKIRFFRLFFVLFTICSYFNTNHSCT